MKNRLVEPNLRLDPDAVAFTQKITVEDGQAKEILPYPRVATDEITKAVIANLGEWKYN